MGLTKTFLAIGIAIIFAVFISYALYVFNETPYSVCADKYNCYQQEQKCQEFSYAEEKYSHCIDTVHDTEEWKSCNQQSMACSNKANTLSYSHNRDNFFILAILGIAAIVAGVFLKKLEGIGSGFLGGGVLVILWSLIYTWEYWLNWPKYLKVALLGLVLVLLVYLGYTKIENIVKKKK